MDLASGTGGGEALEQLCRAYWYPLYAFARRSGQAPADAEDLTQGFFEKLLEKRWLADAEREKGRLRTFLLTAFQRYMANEWRRDQAERRGGGWTRVAWEHADGEQRYAAAAADAQPEELFDRHVGVSYAELTVERELGFPTVHVDCEFRQPLRYGDLLQISTTVPEIGNSSVLFVDEVRVGDDPEPRVVARFRRVAVNMKTLESEPVPDWIRARLESLQG